MFEITPIGFLVIPVSLYLLLRSKSTGLFYLFTLVAPFSAATVFIIKGSKFGVPPAFFVGAVFIAAIIMKLGSSRHYHIAKTQKTFIFLICVFWMIALISLLFPIILYCFNVSYQLFNPAFPDKDLQLPFLNYTITQFVYFTFFNLIAFAIMIEVDTIDKVCKCIKIFLYCSLFTVLWGVIVQYSSFYMKYDYPDWLFNNHPGYAQGFSQHIFIIPRICSVAQEPSVYGYYLTSVISITVILWLNKLYIINKTMLTAILLSLVLTTILTTSSTAYIGLAVIICMALMHYLHLDKILRFRIIGPQLRLVKFLLLGLSLLIIVFLLGIRILQFDTEYMFSIIQNITTQKASSYSGEERLETFKLGIKTLCDSYFIGTGWGSNRTFELGSTLLANVGLAGFISFIAIVVYLNYYLVTYRKKCSQLNNGLSTVILSLQISFMSMLVLMFVSIPDFVNCYYLLILGLILSLPKVVENTMKKISVIRFTEA